MIEVQLARGAQPFAFTDSAEGAAIIDIRAGSLPAKARDVVGLMDCVVSVDDMDVTRMDCGNMERLLNRRMASDAKNGTGARLRLRSDMLHDVAWTCPNARCRKASQADLGGAASRTVQCRDCGESFAVLAPVRISED